jgi:hypothetical protein
MQARITIVRSQIHSRPGRSNGSPYESAFTPALPQAISGLKPRRTSRRTVESREALTLIGP